MKSYVYNFIHVTSFIHTTSFKNKYDFFEFIRSFDMLLMNPYMNYGVPRFQMDSPRDQPLAWQRILNMHSYWNACLFGFQNFQEIPTDSLHCSRDQPGQSPLANTRQYPFNRLGMNYQLIPPLCSLTLTTNPSGWNWALPSLGASVSWLCGALGTLKTTDS